MTPRRTRCLARAARRSPQARAYLELFLPEIVEKITSARVPGGRAAALGHPGEPFRRKEDVDRLRGDWSWRVSPPIPTRTTPPAGRGSVDVPSPGRALTLAFEGAAVQLSEAKGLQDLAQLLSQPQQEIHCLELAGRTTEPTGDAPMLDERARREIGGRVRELQETIDEAEADHDPGRAESAREELERIVELLSGSLGLGGKPRRLGSAAERARSAVTWRIRNAIRKIASVHPLLGRHLDNAIRTGTYCAYVPEKTVDWMF